jgi:hypothetical protein
MAGTPCARKHRYATRKAALGSASIFQRERKIKLYVYKCPDCHYYHLTGNVQ